MIPILISCLLAGTVLPVSAVDRVEWEPVEGADHYRVEIRQGGALVLETRSDEAWLPLFLPPGEYEFQVRVINTFGKEASRTDWSPLRILAPAIPFIISITPREYHDGGAPIYRARVSGYVPPEDDEDGSRFQLTGAEDESVPLTVAEAAPGIDDEGNDASWWDIRLETGRKSPGIGAWNLTMSNPDGRMNRMDDAITVLDRLRPRIRGASPREIPAGATHNPLTVEITGLETGSEVIFDGPSRLRTALLREPKPGVLEYSVNLKDAEVGWYSIRVENPSGGSDVKEKAFEVLPTPLTEEEIAALNALRIDEKEPVPLPEYPHSAFLGWSISIPIGETAGFYTTDYVGISTGYAQSFHNDFFRRLRWLRGLGWDAAYIYTNHSTAYPIAEIRLNRHHFLLGLNYVSPFDFPVNIVLRASSGIGLSQYTSPDYGRDEDLGGFSLRELDSLDYVVRLGGGVRVDFGARWYVDAVCDISGTFYLTRTAWSLQPRLEGGWRW